MAAIAKVLKFLDQHVGTRRLEWRQALRAIGAILAAMLDPKQRHTLLKADRTQEVEVEDVLRAAAGTAYLIGTAEGFEVVMGMPAMLAAVAAAGMTAEMNRAVLAAEPITLPATLL